MARAPMGNFGKLSRFRYPTGVKFEKCSLQIKTLKGTSSFRYQILLPLPHIES